VLKFYPAIDEASTACLRFVVEISSRAVQLLVAVSDMSEDSTKNTNREEVRSDDNVVHRQQVEAGTQSFTILRGRQYVIFTATKIKITMTSDRVLIHAIRFDDRPCENTTMRKYHYLMVYLPMMTNYRYRHMTMIQLVQTESIPSIGD